MYSTLHKALRTGLVNVAVHQGKQPLRVEVRVLVAIAGARVGVFDERLGHHVVVPRKAVVEHPSGVRPGEVVLEGRGEVVGVARRDGDVCAVCRWKKHPRRT